MVIGSTGNVVVGNSVNINNLTTTGTITSLGTTQLTHTLTTGIISNNNTGICLTFEARTFGTGWVINTTNWLPNNLNSTQ
jgi:hypothetical protein